MVEQVVDKVTGYAFEANRRGVESIAVLAATTCREIQDTAELREWVESLSDNDLIQVARSYVLARAGYLADALPSLSDDQDV